MAKAKKKNFKEGRLIKKNYRLKIKDLKNLHF